LFIKIAKREDAAVSSPVVRYSLTHPCKNLRHIVRSKPSFFDAIHNTILAKFT